MEKRNWFNKTFKEVEKELETDLEKGLSKEKAEERQAAAVHPAAHGHSENHGLLHFYRRGRSCFLHHQAHKHQRPPRRRSQREDPCAPEHTQRTGWRGAAGNELP